VTVPVSDRHGRGHGHGDRGPRPSPPASESPAAAVTVAEDRQRRYTGNSQTRTVTAAAANFKLNSVEAGCTISTQPLSSQGRRPAAGAGPCPIATCYDSDEGRYQCKGRCLRLPGSLPIIRVMPSRRRAGAVGVCRGE
jgi:hypothetical protein